MQMNNKLIRAIMRQSMQSRATYVWPCDGTSRRTNDACRRANCFVKCEKVREKLQRLERNRKFLEKGRGNRDLKSVRYKRYAGKSL